jgi:hypothetical protein
MYFDGSKGVQGARDGVVLISPQGGQVKVRATDEFFTSFEQ